MKTNNVFSIIALSGCILAGSVSSSFASEINVSTVSASSTFSTYDVNNLINNSGISGDYHDGNFPNKWLTNGTVTGSLIFDLGSNYFVGSTTVWNYGAGCCGVERSVRDLGISYSTNGGSYTNFGDIVLNQNMDNPFLGESISLGFNARYIQFSLNSNYGDSSYSGLSEVKFYAPVPEPEAYAMLLAGLGLMGAIARRRKQK